MLSSLINDVHYPTVSIPGGEVALRDDRAKRIWTTGIKPFLLAPYPVTMECIVQLRANAMS